MPNIIEDSASVQFPKVRRNGVFYIVYATPTRREERRGEVCGPGERFSPVEFMGIPGESAADSFRSLLRNTSDSGQTAGDTPLIHACSTDQVMLAIDKWSKELRDRELV